MAKNSKMTYLLRVVRKKYKWIDIDTRNKTIYFDINNEEEVSTMEAKNVKRLCVEFGFARQSTLK